MPGSRHIGVKFGSKYPSTAMQLTSSSLLNCLAEGIVNARVRVVASKSWDEFACLHVSHMVTNCSE